MTSRRGSCIPGRCRSITSFIASGDRPLWPFSRPRTHPEPLADRRPDVAVRHRAGPLARLRTLDSRWLPAPRPAEPRAREIVNAAREPLEETGIEALAMRRVAQQIGSRAPLDLQTPAPQKNAPGSHLDTHQDGAPPGDGQGNRPANSVAGYRARGAVLALASEDAGIAMPRFAIACSPSTPSPFLERSSHDAPSTLPSRAAPPAQREPLRALAPRTRADTNAGLGTVDDVRLLHLAKGAHLRPSTLRPP